MATAPPGARYRGHRLNQGSVVILRAGPLPVLGLGRRGLGRRGLGRRGPGLVPASVRPHAARFVRHGALLLGSAGRCLRREGGGPWWALPDAADPRQGWGAGKPLFGLPAPHPWGRLQAADRDHHGPLGGQDRRGEQNEESRREETKSGTRHASATGHSAGRPTRREHHRTARPSSAPPHAEGPRCRRGPTAPGPFATGRFTERRLLLARTVATPGARPGTRSPVAGDDPIRIGTSAIAPVAAARGLGRHLVRHGVFLLGSAGRCLRHEGGGPWWALPDAADPRQGRGGGKPRSLVCPHPAPGAGCKRRTGTTTDPLPTASTARHRQEGTQGGGLPDASASPDGPEASRPLIRHRVAAHPPSAGLRSDASDGPGSPRGHPSAGRNPSACPPVRCNRRLNGGRFTPLGKTLTRTPGCRRPESVRPRT